MLNKDKCIGVDSSYESFVYSSFVFTFCYCNFPLFESALVCRTMHRRSIKGFGGTVGSPMVILYVLTL